MTGAGADDIPPALRQLIDAWMKEGASREEIIARLDELELLAQEERETLIALVSEWM